MVRQGERPFRPRQTKRQLILRVAVLVGLLALPVLAWARTIRMPGSSYRGPLPKVTSGQVALAAELKRDVEQLANAVGERNVRYHRSLERSADFIQSELERLGRAPQRQTYEVAGKACHNLELELRGTGVPSEIIVVGAHYDSAPGTPGANDNGSGVAALLALARRMSGLRPTRTLRLVWFTNEEPPHFQTPNMGSVRYAYRARKRGEDIVAMLSLETMGHFSDAPGSQHYPWPLTLFYPDRGDFIAFVSNVESRELTRRALAIFRAQTRFPSEGAALPESLPGVGWSDHWSFAQQGYSAVMISDTAPFRYRHYHAATDTPEKLDYERLARVVEGIAKVALKLSEEGLPR